MNGPGVVAGMLGFLFDTLAWTGALLVLVLLVRRPVARLCGPQVAYALWALVLVRFWLPPIVVPAGWAGPSAARAAGEALAPDLLAGGAALAPPGLALADGLIPHALLLVWLGGAAHALASRTRAYRAMRRAVLARAVPVGRAGAVRILESPVVRAPLAFGLLDKVVALPPGFMAQADEAAREYAIAHELAHHRGWDLLANLAAQPILALHWFNPLAGHGWRALRQDQEAACDARVVAGRSRQERAAYAQVIARFAMARGPAQAGQPACPPLACSMIHGGAGDKSILVRLRRLAAGERAPAARRGGLAGLALAILLLPLTATVVPQGPPARALASQKPGVAGAPLAVGFPAAIPAPLQEAGPESGPEARPEARPEAGPREAPLAGAGIASRAALVPAPAPVRADAALAAARAGPPALAPSGEGAATMGPALAMGAVATGLRGPPPAFEAVAFARIELWAWPGDKGMMRAVILQGLMVGYRACEPALGEGPLMAAPAPLMPLASACAPGGEAGSPAALGPEGLILHRAGEA